jgi:predicted transcriptional regulator of viral defense system
MEFRELLEIIGEEPVFETGLLLAGAVDPDHIQRQLVRWKNAGKIYQLRRGVYTLAPPYYKITPHPFLIANRLQRPSYISRQSALAYFGIIPESVPVTTSVTTARPNRWSTPIGIFDFRHIQVDLFFGYQEISLRNNQTAMVATPEKALIDLIYLQPEGDSHEYLKELRLQQMDRLNLQILKKMADRAKKPKLTRAAVLIAELALEEASQYENL